MYSTSSAPDNVVADIEHGGITYYVCIEDDFLVEVIDNEGLSPPEDVGPALPGTHGTYVLHEAEQQRAFHCLNNDAILQDFEFDAGQDVWNAGSLVSLRIQASPRSDFGAAATESGTVYVFFQDAAQQIQAVRRDGDGQWERVAGLPQTQAPEGASIFAMAMKDTVHVFYSHRDLSIYDMTLRGGLWTSKSFPAYVQVPLTNSVDRKTSIHAAPSGNDAYGVEYTNEQGEVYIIDNGVKTLQGRHTESGFVKKDGAEGWNPRGCQLFGRRRR